MRVICFLWPQGSLQAPADDPGAGAPQWGAKGANLVATAKAGTVQLKWSKAAAAAPAARYDVYRADEQGRVHVEDAVKVTRWEDHNVLGGSRYRYYVRAYAPTGQGSVPSNTVVVDLPKPDYMAPRGRGGRRALLDDVIVRADRVFFCFLSPRAQPE